MKQFDRFVQQLLRMDASALVLTSNAPVVALLPDGTERTSTQSIEHGILAAALQEVVPAAALADLRAARPLRFRYPEDAPIVAVDAQPAAGAWRVAITALKADGSPVLPLPSDAAAAPAGSPPQPAAAAAAAVVTSSPPAPPAAPPPPAAPAPRPAPRGESGTEPLDRLLRAMAQRGASDLHISSARPPMMRLHGEIMPLEEGAAALSPEGLRALILPTMPPHIRRQYESQNDADYAYELAGVSRFRANAFVDRRGPCAVFRRIPFEIVPAEELGLSRHVLDLCNLSKGLVLVTGPTGSGKSTTLAALVDRINATRKDHIITIEDPIEFVHRNRKCLVNQREVRVHTDGFKDALRAALREDPDIVLVGEMRDLETVAIAIETAETGHLVFGTLHTRTAPSTVDRIIDQFSADRQAQIRMMLAESLKAVIAQTLCKRLSGGRVAAYEILLCTPAVSNMIREGKTYQLPGVMQTARNVGMMTLNDALCELVKTGKIDAREAWFRALNKVEMRTVMLQAGIPVPGG